MMLASVDFDFLLVTKRKCFAPDTHRDQVRSRCDPADPGNDLAPERLRGRVSTGCCPIRVKKSIVNTLA